MPAKVFKLPQENNSYTIAISTQNINYHIGSIDISRSKGDTYYRTSQSKTNLGWWQDSKKNISKLEQIERNIDHFSLHKDGKTHFKYKGNANPKYQKITDNPSLPLNQIGEKHLVTDFILNFKTCPRSKLQNHQVGEILFSKGPFDNLSSNEVFPIFLRIDLFSTKNLLAKDFPMISKEDSKAKLLKTYILPLGATSGNSDKAIFVTLFYLKDISLLKNTERILFLPTKKPTEVMPLEQIDYHK